MLRGWLLSSLGYFSRTGMRSRIGTWATLGQVLASDHRGRSRERLTVLISCHACPRTMHRLKENYSTEPVKRIAPML